MDRDIQRRPSLKRSFSGDEALAGRLGPFDELMTSLCIGRDESVEFLPAIWPLY